MKTVGKESLLQNQLHYLSFPKGWKKTQLPLKSKDMGRVSLKAENNNRMKNAIPQWLVQALISHKSKLKIHALQCYNSEQATLLKKHKIICMIEKRKKN